MEEYERCFADEKEARETAKTTGGKISRFWSIDESDRPIIVYAVRCKQLF